MYMMVQISSFGVDVIFYFSSYLAEEIHTGLVGIAKGKVEKPLDIILY
jgi:ABC-type amino acid transport system permease subunit